MKEQEVYKQVANNYLEEIMRFIPGYGCELVPALLEEILEETEGIKDCMVLDIGSGVGNLSKKLLDKSEILALYCIEPSQHMMFQAMEILRQDSDRICLQPCTASQFESDANTFDVVYSNLVLHNIQLQEKIELVKKIFRWLKPGGSFIWSDLITFHELWDFMFWIEYRKTFALEHGASEELVEINFQKEMEQDHFMTTDQMAMLLASAGFSSVEILWQGHMVDVLKAVKAPITG